MTTTVLRSTNWAIAGDTWWGLLNVAFQPDCLSTLAVGRTSNHMPVDWSNLDTMTNSAWWCHRILAPSPSPLPHNPQGWNSFTNIELCPLTERKMTDRCRKGFSHFIKYDESGCYIVEGTCALACPSSLWGELEKEPVFPEIVHKDGSNKLHIQ